MVTRLEAFDARPDLDNHPGPLMAKNGRKHALRVRARKSEFIGVADAGGLDLDQNFALFRTVEIDLHDFQRLSRLQCYRCPRAHVLHLPGVSV